MVGNVMIRNVEPVTPDDEASEVFVKLANGGLKRFRGSGRRRGRDHHTERRHERDDLAGGGARTDRRP